MVAIQTSNLVLYDAIASLKRVLVISFVTTYIAPVFQLTNEVYAHKCCVFTNNDWTSYSIIQSNIHEAWARHYSSSLETRLNYSPSDCFETFPFPKNTDSLDDIGERYYAHRQSIMLARQEGLTKTYNRFHNPEEHAPDIVALRTLHKEMDEAVARAYGWDDLALEHGFHQTKQGLRYTIREPARREVLDRLLLLNHQRHEEEVQAGLFEKGTKGKKNSTKGTRKTAGNGSIAASQLNEGSMPVDDRGAIYKLAEGDVQQPAEGDVQQGTLF